MANGHKEGHALLHTKGNRETRQYQQWEGNLALANDSLAVVQAPKTRSPQLSLVPDSSEEEIELEALAPTTGILNGIRLSLTLWSLIGLIILLMR
jgi:hypothetical protein